MINKILLRVIMLAVLLAALMPVERASALEEPAIAPSTGLVFQLPWDQGVAWVAIDGFDDTSKRLPGSPHNYLNGGAIDFAPRSTMFKGEDTSNFWVTAAAAGTVIEKSYCHLKIDHGNGWVSEYQFLANIQVRLGQAVFRNQRLAIIADGVRNKFCPPSVENDIPHLHFVLRPTMHNMPFAGWLVKYNHFWNSTTFTKNGKTVGLYKPLMNVMDLQIVLREPITWDTVYIGSVDDYRYERWPFVLEAPTDFTIATTPTTDGLQPLILLLDSSGAVLAESATGTLTTSQPAGDYFVQVQPQAGSGFYELLLTKSETPLPDGPYVSTVVVPPSINVGDTTLATVNLNNIPDGGYTSAEFTCTYDPTVLEVIYIDPLGLFGPDPAVAINGPQDGRFIFAIAGTGGNKAVTSGPVFNFNVTGLQAGQVTLDCAARVSRGNGILEEIPSVADTLNVVGIAPAPAPAFAAFALAALPAISGQVQAVKPVTVNLYAGDASLVSTLPVNADGTFSLEAPAGTYRLVASAGGFLSAQATLTLSDGETRTLPVVQLRAGDIDGNNIIDPFDAMTIGMSYNTAEPEVADLNGDGIINVLDLERLAAHYRESGPTLWFE